MPEDRHAASAGAGECLERTVDRQRLLWHTNKSAERAAAEPLAVAAMTNRYGHRCHRGGVTNRAAKTGARQSRHCLSPGCFAGRSRRRSLLSPWPAGGCREGCRAAADVTIQSAVRAFGALKGRAQSAGEPISPFDPAIHPAEGRDAISPTFPFCDDRPLRARFAGPGRQRTNFCRRSEWGRSLGAGPLIATNRDPLLQRSRFVTVTPRCGGALLRPGDNPLQRHRRGAAGWAGCWKRSI